MVDVFERKGIVENEDHDNATKILQGDLFYSAIHYRDIFIGLR